MKKILIILFICLSVGSFGQSVFRRGIKVGNSSTIATIDSISQSGSTLSIYNGATRVYDDKLLDDALLIEDVALLRTDTVSLVATKHDLDNFEGAGSGVTMYKIQFIVGATGAPGNGDSTVTHTSLIGKEVAAYRGTTGDLSKQYLNITATNGKTGYRFNSTTGTVTFRPVFSTGDRVTIEALNPLNVDWLVLSGTESSLLTGLRAYWNLNETTGTVVDNTEGTVTYDGTTNATVGATGVFGYGETFNGSTQYVNCGTTVGDVGTNDFSLSGWFYQTARSTIFNAAGIAGNWGTYPYFYSSIYSDKKVKGVVNFAGSNIEIFSDDTVALNVWYHVVVRANRDGYFSMVLDGVVQADSADISAHSAVNITNNNTFAIGRVGSSLSNHWFTGSLDEIGLWIKRLGDAECIEAKDETHPFN